MAKSTSPSLKDVVGIIETKLGIEHTPPKPNVFIVHGHNDTLKYELKNYLQNTLGLPEPIILHEQPNMGRTLIQKFEDYAYSSNLAFILLTPDDKPANTDDPDDEKRRARQNVILELGFFLGNLGRETGRVILLYIGPLELPSDLSGVTYIDISNGIESAGEVIRRELSNVSQQSW
jgi:predicted nucleotide-binding protein